MQRLFLAKSQQATSIFWGVLFVISFFSSSVKAEETSAKGWLVQLGSFQIKKNADNFVSRFKKKGYTPFVVQAENSRWYKVRVGPYPSKEEARQVAGDLKKNHKISAMVILSSKGPPDIVDSGDSIDIVFSQLLIWLKAWEAGEANTYLSFYSENFNPPHKSRKEWEKERRFILGRNARTTIQISDMEMKQNDDIIEMSFVQDYKSDRISDIGMKELIWKNEGNSWKIIKEAWAPKK